MKKYSRYIGIVIFVGVVIAAVFLLWKLVKNYGNNSAGIEKKLSDNGGLIDQYQGQLVELKQQAEKSGNASDLQRYAGAQYATGDAAGAEVTYRKQLEKDPKSFLAQGGLANALRDQQKFESAIVAYQKAIELSPSTVSSYVNLASLYQYSMKQVDKAIEVYKQGIEKNPKSVDLRVLLGIAYEQANEVEKAKTIYADVLKIETGNKTATSALERLK